jgi:hypothetical protein
MKVNTASKNWIVDAVMFVGFTVLFYLDLTGVALHQWVGVVIGSLALYHLLVHMNWVEAVTKRLLDHASWKVRLYYLVDAALLLGFTAILVSGLSISTWLSLSLDYIAAWIDFHLVSSIATLALVIVKIAIHWRWIIKSARRMLPTSVSWAPGKPAVQPVAVSSGSERRDFLKLMGLVGAAGTLALFNVTRSAAGGDASENLAQNQTGSTSIISESAISSPGQGNGGSTCITRCRKGRSCAYPGSCPQYTDANRNDLCDLGECV